jgi:hypothetical protein
MMVDRSVWFHWCLVFWLLNVSRSKSWKVIKFRIWIFLFLLRFQSDILVKNNEVWSWYSVNYCFLVSNIIESTIDCISSWISKVERSYSYYLIWKFRMSCLNLLTSCMLRVWQVSFFLWTSDSGLFTLEYPFQILTDGLFFSFLNCVFPSIFILFINPM